MKTATKRGNPKNAWKQIRSLAGCLATAAICLVAGNDAQAHLTYTGRIFGSFTGLAYDSVSITNQVVTGNFGWADAADINLGDSHKGKAFRFHLDSAATVSLLVSANANATGSSLGGLLPAFSIYSGSGAASPADHDPSFASQAWRTDWAQTHISPTADYNDTDGSWNAAGDWKIGGDSDTPGDFAQLSSFLFQGSAVDVDLDGTVFGSFLLDAGDYTIMIGGYDINNKFEGTANSSFGLAATLSVTPVPEPSTYALLLMGAGIFASVARRRQS